MLRKPNEKFIEVSLGQQFGFARVPDNYTVGAPMRDGQHVVPRFGGAVIKTKLSSPIHKVGGPLLYGNDDWSLAKC